MARLSETASLFSALLTFSVSLLSSCQSEDGPDDDESQGPSPELLELRYDDEAKPEDPSNHFALNKRAQLFGQRLFFDPSLSGPLIEGDNDGGGGTLGMMGEAGKISCASCHVPESFFVDTRSPHGQISLAAMWTPRRSPTLLDVAFAPLFNWDGRRDTLWAQAIGVIESHVEFNSGRLFVAQRIFEDYRKDYEEIFSDLSELSDEARFPRLAPTEVGCTELSRITGPEYVCRGKPGDEADYDNMSEADQKFVTEVLVNVAKSLAAYVTQLRCGPSRFDDWLDGDKNALTESEIRGARLFTGSAQCSSCHSGPRLTDGLFHNVGLAPAIVAVAFTDSGDRGAAAAWPELQEDPLNSLGAFSDGPREAFPDELGHELEGSFRTPGLRCLNQQPSFMHTGQYTSLRSVLRFFNDGGHRSGYPGQSELEPLELSDDRLADLEAFLLSLQGQGPPSGLLEAP